MHGCIQRPADRILSAPSAARCAADGAFLFLKPALVCLIFASLLVLLFFRAGLIRGFQTFQFALEDRPEDKLPQIDIPTLVIRGAKDPIVSADWVKQVTRLLPHSNLVTIEDAAHAVNFNSPKAFTEVICEFVQGELFLK